MALDPSLALVTLAAVKRELDMSSSADDGYLESLIHAASDEIQRFLNRELPRKEIEDELLTDNGSTFYAVARTPIVAVTAISDNGTPVTDFGVLNAEAGLIRLRSRAAALRSNHRPGIEQLPNPGFYDARTTIDYEAGYITPVQAAHAGNDYEGLPPTLPYGIQQAAIETVTFLFRNRGVAGGQTGGVHSERIGDAQVIYERAPTYGLTGYKADVGLPPLAVSKLQRYRRIVVV